MFKYRKKPEFIEAVQWTDEVLGDFENLPQWFRSIWSTHISWHKQTDGSVVPYLQTPWAMMRIHNREYVALRGEHPYLISASQFERDFEPLTTED